MKIQASNLKEFGENILMKVKLKPKDAEVLSDTLVEANLRGIDTHGISRLPIYIERLEKNIVNPSPNYKKNKLTDTTMLIDGDNGQGQVVSNEACNEAIKLAKKNGSGFVGVKNSNHFGAAAYYIMKIIEEDLIGFVVSNGPPNMVIYGGAESVFGTNPLAMGFPAESQLPIVIDMSTSVVARGNIILADKENESIPEGWAVDKDGKVTTDTKKALEGAVLPMAGHKGSALAIAIDVLSGVLTGAEWSKNVKSLYNNFEDPQNNGHFFGAIDISGFMPVNNFKKRMDNFILDLKSTPKAPGHEEIYMPGEIEFNTKNKRLKEGIPIGKNVLEELKSLASKYNVDSQI